MGDFGFRGIGEDEQDEVHVLMKLPDHVVHTIYVGSRKFAAKKRVRSKSVYAEVFILLLT